jgi:5-methylthioadenosine/S-adenosylhomocysteine deaminase
MKQVELIIKAGWVIPVEPHATVLKDHCVVVDQGLIVDIVPSNLIETYYNANEIIEKPGHALIPGFVNTHTHASMSLMRGIADDMPLMEWLSEHIWPAEGRWVSREFVRDGTDLAIAEMLRSGTTCFNEMYFFPDDVARQSEKAGIRAVVGLIVIDFPTVWAKDSDEYIHKGIEVYDSLRGNPLIKTAFAPHGPYTVSDEALQKVVVYAEELDIPIHMHIHETADEVRQSVEQHGRRPLNRLDALGLLTPRLSAVHMTQLEEEDIELLVSRGVNMVHCPESNLKLASGFAPVDKCLKAGVNVALGTDGAASNNDLDMLAEMQSAALLGKGVAGDASAVAATTALEMATINGARALGIDDVTGSLLEGKSADIVAINLDTIETQPLYHPISQLVYSSSRSQISDVWVAGRQLLSNRVLTTLNEADILARAKKWQLKLAENHTDK